MNGAVVWTIGCELGKSLLTKALSSRYRVETLKEMKELRERLEASNPAHYPSVIVTDFESCKELAMETVQFAINATRQRIPVVVVSSHADEESIRTCFRAGVADYLTYSSSMGEMFARIERCVPALTDQGMSSRQKPRSGDFGMEIDMSSMTALHHGSRTEVLTVREMQILVLLINSDGKPVTRNEFVRKVWLGLLTTPKTLDVHISNLRKKISGIGLAIVHVPPNSFRMTMGAVARSA